MLGAIYSTSSGNMPRATERWNCGAVCVFGFAVLSWSFTVHVASTKLKKKGGEQMLRDSDRSRSKCFTRRWSSH